MEKITIGKIIEKEVRRRQIQIVDFAEKIHCQRSNVYNIFSRSSIDILQLKLISEVLNHDFFRDLANDLDLIEDNRSKEDKAVGQFFSVVPEVLGELGKTSAIVFCDLDDEDEMNGKMPDFGLSDYRMTFTINDTLENRLSGCSLLYVERKSKDGDDKCWVEICKNKVYNTVYVNIKLDYKTKEEWNNCLSFAFSIYDHWNCNK